MNEWKRNFQPERISRLDQILHGWRGGYRKPPKTLIAERQAQFIDTNFYYRVGGVDPVKAAARNDLLAIQWGIGSRKCDTFDDQVAIAKSQDLKYFTWAILDVSDPKPIEQQVEIWHGTPGATEAPMFIDQEKPRSYTRYLNANELRTAVLRIMQLSTFRPGCYSRVNIFEDVFNYQFPDWFEDVAQWIAQYLLYWNGSAWVQYRYYDDFLNKWEWALPPAVVKSPMYKDGYWRSMVEAWQFTDKGDAEYYIAPEWISPGQPGMKSCDLNVSIKPLPEFIISIFGEEPPLPPPPPPPPDPPPTECTCTERLDAIEVRLDALEAKAHEHEQPPDGAIFVTINTDKAVAFASTKTNDAGYPIININAYDVTKDAALKWEYGDRVAVLPDTVRVDGGADWWVLVGVDTHGYDRLYLEKARTD